MSEGSVGISFVLVDPDDEITFGSLYRVYADSIDPHGQKSREQLRVMLREPAYRFIVARGGGVVLGIAVLFAPAGASFVLLEYLAVAASARGAGVGAELFREGVRLALAGRDVPVLVEVDAPEAQPADSVALPRERFYRQELGCLKVAGCRYQLPLRAHGASPPMDLLVWFPAARRELGRDELKRCLQTIYRSVYGCRTDDPRIDEMLKRVEDPVRLA